MAGTILVDGRLQSNTSYRAEAMGKLTATILLHCLYTFINRNPTKPTYHTCDNRALVSRINTIHNNNDHHTITDPIDRDIIIPTAFWANQTWLQSKWVRGHAECRKDNINDWTNNEWANDISDT